MIPSRYKKRTIHTIKSRLDKAGILIPTARTLLQKQRFGDAARSLWYLSLHAKLDQDATAELRRSVRVLRKLEKDRPRDVRYRSSEYIPSLSTIKADVSATKFPVRSDSVLARRNDVRPTHARTPKALERAPKAPERARTPAVPNSVYEALKRYEGLPRDRDPGMVYKNVHGLPTVGYGHLVTPKSRQTFRSLFGPSFDFDALQQGKRALTRNQIDRLFRHDMNTRIDQVRAVLPAFDRYPAYLQEQIMSAKYRGDLGPKTLGHLKRGEWNKAADEVKRTADYRVRGIKPRLDRVSDAFRRYGRNKNAPSPVASPKPAPKTSPASRAQQKTPRLHRFARGAGRAARALGQKVLEDARRARVEFDAEVKRIESDERVARLKAAARRGSEKARNELRKHQVHLNRVRREASRRIANTRDEAQKRVQEAKKELDHVVKTTQTRAAPHVERARAEAKRVADDVRPKLEKASRDLARRARDAKAAANRAARRVATEAMRKLNRGPGARRLQRPKGRR